MVFMLGLGKWGLRYRPDGHTARRGAEGRDKTNNLRLGRFAVLFGGTKGKRPSENRFSDGLFAAV
ncbi:hypothetical protein [Kingella potus]|uniref:hypothetical protein n=1 Tax=Kingella potus TaxID=265175 RepID=UPI001FD0B919|nr:hypothetical protein [Kingella potus]UOP00783.1 hypothetical protein LVJ84_13670 [Kingella potus]